MQEFISPEPLRSMFASEEAYAHAWMEWAQTTPGGWRARIAERVEDQHRRVRRIPVRWLDGPEVAQPAPEPGPTDCAQVRSPCCAADVVIDPAPAKRRKGLCSCCGTLLTFIGAGWWHSP